MNIDLLVTNNGEAGIVSDAVFDSPVAGIMYDAQTGVMSIEFSDMNALDMNIPVDSDLGQYLYYSMSVQVGAIEKGTIQDNRQVPLVVTNDHADGGGMSGLSKISNSVRAFENFLKQCVTGQPLHREDLSNEDSIDGVMSGINTAVLQFAPHLARQRNMEAAPTMAPRGPAGPSGPGGMGGGGMSGGGGYTGGTQGSGHGSGQDHDNRRGRFDDDSE